MPFKTIDEAKKAGFPTEKDSVPLSIGQVNKLAEIYDAIKEKGSADNPMAIAWHAWGQVYKKEGDKWLEAKVPMWKADLKEIDGNMFILKALELSGAPSVVQLLPLGEWRGHPDGEFNITPDVIRTMISNFEKGGRKRVVDYEHQTLKGVEAPAAGFVTRLLDGGEKGLMGEVEWNDRAIDYLEKKEYQFLSPVFTMNRIDKHSGEDIGAYYHSAAITNDPFIDEIMPLVNKGFFINSEQIIKNNMEEKKMLQKLIELLKLGADATEEDVISAIEEMAKKMSEKEVVKILNLKDGSSLNDVKNTLSAFKNTMEALGLKEGATIDEVKRTVLSLKENKKKDDGNYVSAKEFNDLKAEHEATSKALKDTNDKLALKDRDDLVKSAMDEKKLTDEERKEWGDSLALKDPDSFKKIIATRKPIVNTDRIHDGNRKAVDDKDAQREKLIEEKQALRKCSYQDAALLVAKDRPELFNEAFE